MVYIFFHELLIFVFFSCYLGQAQAQVPPTYGGDFTMPQPQVPSSYGVDYNIPQPQAAPSHTTFFSPQAAFYAPSSQQQIPPNQAIPGMEYFSNNPLFNVGLNVVEQGMKDFTGKSVNMLPNEVKKIFLFIFLIYLFK
jgi:hypothetical protein